MKKKYNPNNKNILKHLHQQLTIVIVIFSIQYYDIDEKKKPRRQHHISNNVLCQWQPHKYFNWTYYLQGDMLVGVYLWFK